MGLQQSEEYGTLQRLVDAMYRHQKRVSQLEVIGLAQSYDLTADLQEIVDLLPPGTYSRRRLCDQFNSAITGHGWGLIYGTVE